MFEKGLDAEEGEGSETEEIAERNIENNEVGEVQKGNVAPALRREPSFSRWCDENGTEVHLNSSDRSAGTDAEDCDFELPLLHITVLENEISERERKQFSRLSPRNMNSNLGYNVENLVTRKVPFGIDNGKSFRDNDDYLGNSRKGFNMKNDLPSSFCMATVIRTMILIVAWYTFSTFLTLYNKTLLGDKLGKFPAPFLMNTIHFSMQAVLSKLMIRFWLKGLQPNEEMSWKDYYMRVVPTAIGTALDVNLSNISLVFISVTFATMCKSASPIFLLLFAFAFKLESPSLKLLGIIVIISIGILLTVAKEAEFELWGFIFVMLAAVMSGFRWCMTQILLQKEAYGLKHPLTLMCYIAPVMAVGTALLSSTLDPWHEFRRSDYFNNSWHIFQSCLLLLLGGIIAFCMVLTEYVLVSETSAVTVTIAGVVKEAVTILVAVFYFHDQFTWLKGVGLLTIMVGVSLFNWYKYEKLQKGLQHEIDLGRVSATGTVAPKYVILENMGDEHDDAS